MKKWLKIVLAAAVLLGIAIFVLVYTRPLTIQQRYPTLDLSHCTGIHGYYNDGTGDWNAQYTIRPGDPHFEQAVGLVRSAVFRTRLRNLFPSGTKTHPYSAGDFRWYAILRFEDAPFPDGTTGGGDLLEIDNFYGDLTMYFIGEGVQCRAEDQDRWLKNMMDIITQYPD